MIHIHNRSDVSIRTDCHFLEIRSKFVNFVYVYIHYFGAKKYRILMVRRNTDNI